MGAGGGAAAQQRLHRRAGGGSMSARTSQDWSMPGSLLDRAIRTLYRIAYRGHLAVNFVLRPETRGVYVAVWLDDRVLLIRNSYKSIYTLPCGGIGEYESPVDAARRELLEEVGLDLPVDAFKLVYETTNTTEYKQDRIHLFEVRLSDFPALTLDGLEVIWAGFRTPTSALFMRLFPSVREYLLLRMDAEGVE
jgi:8-oxo-dGTP diphosphatase